MLSGTVGWKGSGCVSSNEIDEIGPIDYVLIESPDRQPNGEAALAIGYDVQAAFEEPGG